MSAANLSAGDNARLKFTGFSEDSGYLAFEEDGINDNIDDASAYSAIYLVNTEKNDFAAAPKSS